MRKILQSSKVHVIIGRPLREFRPEFPSVPKSGNLIGGGIEPSSPGPGAAGEWVPDFIRGLGPCDVSNIRRRLGRE